MDFSVVTSLGWVCDYALLTDLALSILVALGSASASHASLFATQSPY